MLDINFIRQNPDVVKNNVRRRDSSYVPLIDEVLHDDELWRNLKAKVDQARSRRNKVSQEINTAKKEGKDIAALKQEAADIPKLIAEAEGKLNDLADKIRSALLKIPNMVHESVPDGKDESENKVEKTVGKKPKFSFTPKKSR